MRLVLGPGRLRFVMSLLFLEALVLFELTTGAAYYWVMERRVGLLQELLSMSGVAGDPQLAPVYEGLRSQLSAGPTFAYLPLSVGKFFAGAFLGLVMLANHFWRTFSGPRQPYWLAGLYVSLFFTVALGLIGALIPDIGAPLVNAIVYIVVEFLALVVLGIGQNARGVRGHPSSVAHDRVIR